MSQNNREKKAFSDRHYVVLHPVDKVYVAVFVHSSRVAGVEPEVSEIFDCLLGHLVIVVKHHVRYSGTHYDFSYASPGHIFVRFRIGDLALA